MHTNPPFSRNAISKTKSFSPRTCFLSLPVFDQWMDSREEPMNALTSSFPGGSMGDANGIRNASYSSPHPYSIVDREGIARMLEGARKLWIMNISVKKTCSELVLWLVIPGHQHRNKWKWDAALLCMYVCAYALMNPAGAPGALNSPFPGRIELIGERMKKYR